MAFQYGQGSLAARKGVHPNLLKVFDKVLEHYDHCVTCGVRSRAAQEKLFREGKSKLSGDSPNARHVLQEGQQFGLALDVAPFPVLYPENGKTPQERQKLWARFYFFAGFVFATAKEMGIELRFGGDWNGDWDFRDNTFDDLVHWELISPK